jgi:hypothetical protein
MTAKGRHRRRPALQSEAGKKPGSRLLKVIATAVTGLLSALIGAGASVWVATYQVKATQGSTANGFLISQEQTYYASFSNDGHRLSTDWNYYLTGRTSLAGEILSLTENLRSDYDNLLYVINVYAKNNDRPQGTANSDTPASLSYSYKTTKAALELEAEGHLADPGVRKKQLNAEMQKLFAAYTNYYQEFLDSLDNSGKIAAEPLDIWT